MIWAWFALYFVVVCAVPFRKEQRGYIWRLLRKLPPWRWVRGFSRIAIALRFWLLLWLWTGALEFLISDDATFTAVQVGGLIVVWLDDYVNGDDNDRWKLGEWARNAVKWLMELPAPRESETA